VNVYCHLVEPLQSSGNPQKSSVILSHPGTTPVSLNVIVATTLHEVKLAGEYSTFIASGTSLSIQSTTAVALHVFPALSLNSHVQLPFSPNTTTVAFPPDKGEGAEGGRGFVKEYPLSTTTPVLLKLTEAITLPLVAPVVE
jgi:hypothetical protein